MLLSSILIPIFTFRLIVPNGPLRSGFPLRLVCGRKLRSANALVLCSLLVVAGCATPNRHSPGRALNWEDPDAGVVTQVPPPPVIAPPASAPPQGAAPTKPAIPRFRTAQFRDTWVPLQRWAESNRVS